MPKTVLRLKADRRILQQGNSVEILALLSAFKSPATARDSEGRLLKHLLWQRWDSLDVVALAQQAGLPLDAGDVFEATNISGDIDGATAQLVVDRLMSFERAGFSLTAADGEGRTLIHRMAHGFHPAIMAFLEDRGLDPLATTPSLSGEPPESAFSIVFHATDAAMDNSAIDHFAKLSTDFRAEPSTDNLMSSLCSPPPAFSATMGVKGSNASPLGLDSLRDEPPHSRTALFSESFSDFLRQAAREMAQAQNQRIAWLEHCVKIGAPIPPSVPLLNAQGRWAIFQTHQAGAAAPDGRNESRLRAHLEAVALRHEMEKSRAAIDGASPSPADGQLSTRKAPRI